MKRPYIICHIERMAGPPKSSPMKFVLEGVERIGGDGLWMRYKVKS